jgi:hypothetical protein
MATQTKPNPVTASIETAADRVNEFSEKAIESGRKTSTVLLDSYEKTAVALADSYVKAARSTHLEWISSMADAQADFAREVTKSYVGAARTFVD